MQKNCTRVYSSAAPLAVITVLNNNLPVATETRQHFVPSAPTDAIINRMDAAVKKSQYSYYYKARNN